jgi:hypothetical protein
VKSDDSDEQSYVCTDVTALRSGCGGRGRVKKSAVCIVW